MARRTVFVLSVLAAFLSAAPVALSAEDTCGGRGEDIIRKAYPDVYANSDGLFEIDGDDGGDVITPPDAKVYSPQAKVMICRQWPARPDLLLVAMPIVSFWSAEFVQGDIDLLVMDFETLAVRHRLKLDDAMESDALRIETIAFDTALYQLSPDTLAFGLRIGRQDRSHDKPLEQSTLRLFAIDNGDLRLVLDRLVVSENGGEWLAICNGTFRDTRRKLAMAKAATGEMADIVVSDTVVSSRFNKTEPSGECKSTDETKTAKHRLRFENNAYVVRQELRGL